MRHQAFTTVVVCVALAALVGCSNSTGPASAGPTGGPAAGANPGPVAVNTPKAETYIRCSLDGQQAQENGKGIAGELMVKAPVSTSPKLRFDIIRPEKVGRIRSVIVGIFQQTASGASQSAQYTVSTDPSNPQAQMKSGTVYDLGNPGKDVKVFDSTGKEVKGVKLQPGKEYRLALKVKGDREEDAQVEFKTR